MTQNRHPLLQLIPKINFGILIGALLLFLLPWTSVQCNGREIASQSGVQSVYGGISMSGELEGLGKGETSPMQNKKGGTGAAVIVAVALLFVFVALVVTSLIVFNNLKPSIDPGMISALALGLLLLQAVIGFPVDKSVSEDQQQAPASAQGMPKELEMKMTSSRTPWFYFEVIFLMVPTGLFVYSKTLPQDSAATMPPEEDEI